MGSNPSFSAKLKPEMLISGFFIFLNPKNTFESEKEIELRYFFCSSENSCAPFLIIIVRKQTKFYNSKVN